MAVLLSYPNHLYIHLNIYTFHHWWFRNGNLKKKKTVKATLGEKLSTENTGAEERVTQHDPVVAN